MPLPSPESPHRRTVLIENIKNKTRALLSRLSESPDGVSVSNANTAVSRSAIQELVGQSVNDLAIYEQALTHRSVLRQDGERYTASNERLEFLGDAVLGLLVAEYLYDEFPKKDEGFLTQMRSKLVNNKRALARFAEAIDLGDYVILSPNMEQSGGRNNASILADAFEAVIGALYLDQGEEAAGAFVQDTIFNVLDVTVIAQQRHNYKSALQEYVQARGWSHPEYRLISEEGPSHRRLFTVEVLVRGNSRGQGTGRSKKKAEQEAAGEALERLKADEKEPVG